MVTNIKALLCLGAKDVKGRMYAVLELAHITSLAELLCRIYHQTLGHQQIYLGWHVPSV